VRGAKRLGVEVEGVFFWKARGYVIEIGGKGHAWYPRSRGLLYLAVDAHQLLAHPQQ